MGAAALGSALGAGCSSLTSLGLEQNNIDASGAVSLARALRLNTALAELSLANNNIGNEGASALGEALALASEGQLRGVGV